MKISEQWLRRWIDVDADVDTLVHRLTMAGLEIGGCEVAAEKFEKVIIGQITEIEPHPDADKLQICLVQTKVHGDLTIVCGAKNIKLGDKVPVALVGARLPNGLTISPQKLKGQASNGMICSAEELGLAETSEGVMILDDNAPLGQECFEYFQLDDHILEVDLTPNRGDCLSVRGLSRELSVLFNQAVTEPEIHQYETSISDQVHVEVADASAAPVYACRVIRNVNPKAKTPLWMQERLRRSGIRAISPSVDVTNYVMLELGQPMHAFDRNQIDGGIHVRYAKPEETLTLLDGKTIELQPDCLLIADDEKPLALAGVMGGEHSGVADETNAILLESAYFNPTTVAGKARRFGLVTESSHRFERGVDYQIQVMAIERATELLLSIIGGEPGPIVTQMDESALPKVPAIHLRRKTIEKILGMSLPDQIVNDIFKGLQLNADQGEDGWTVQVPSHRFDIRIEADLVEELARVYGFDKIDAQQTLTEIAFPRLSEEQLALTDVHDVLAAIGYQEVITYSFIDPAVQELVDPDADTLQLKNPISQDMSVMRSSIWPGLLQTLAYNQNRQQDALRLFESGLCFRQSGENLLQTLKVAGLLSGNKRPESWAAGAESLDFYDLKADMEHVLQLTKAPQAFTFKPASHYPALHPGQTAEVLREGEVIGVLGALHPRVQQKLALKGTVLLFELDYDALSKRALPAFKPVSKFPSIRRDIALVVGEAVKSDDIKAVIQKSAGELLQSVRVFDVYRGEGVAKDKKSIALGLTLQHQSRTLIDDDVNVVIDQVINDLETELSATMRE